MLSFLRTIISHWYKSIQVTPQKTGLIVLLLCTTLFRQVSAQSSFSSQETAANQTVVDFFEALSSADTSRIRSLTTADFILLENGEVWTIQMLINYMRGINLNDFKRINNLEFIDTDIKGKAAWTAYHNSASITTKGQTTDIHWLESAFLQKQRGAWKIRMLHSTNKPKKP